MIRVKKSVSILLAIIMILSVFTILPVSVSAAEDYIYVGITSDVHGNTTGLNNWINYAHTATGATLDRMLYCGDFGDSSHYKNTTPTYQADFDSVVTTTDSRVSNGGVYTSGNHDYQAAMSGPNDTSNIELTEAMLRTAGFMRIGLALDTPDYAVYCFGAASNYGNEEEIFPENDVERLAADFDSDLIPSDKPVFILSHFPLHYHKGGGVERAIGNADKVIDILNNHPEKQIIFVWGHNHSKSDHHYGQVLTEGYSIQYDASNSKYINFTYACAGGMRQISETEYSGAVAKINKDTKAVTFSYYRFDNGASPKLVTPTTTVTTYELTDSLTDNGEYLIVSANAATNSAAALKNNNTSSASNTTPGTQTVKVESVNSKMTVTNVTDDSAIIWKASGSSTNGFTLSNSVSGSARYLYRSNSNLQVSSSNTRWKYSNNQLYYKRSGSNTSYYIQYSNSSFAALSTSAKRIYLYKKTQTTVDADPATVYTVSTDAGKGGSVSPKSAVVTGGDVTFTFTPDTDDDYVIESVTVDDSIEGVELDSNNSYTITNITANHTIHAGFKWTEPAETAPTGENNYKLVDKITEGKDYLIVNTKKVGSGYAVKNIFNEDDVVGKGSVNVCYYDVDNDKVKDRYIGEPDDTLIWHAVVDEDTGNGYWLYNTDSDGKNWYSFVSGTPKFKTKGDQVDKDNTYWYYDSDNELLMFHYVSGSTTGEYLGVYDSDAFTGSKSVSGDSSQKLFLYEKVDEVIEEGKFKITVNAGGNGEVTLDGEPEGDAGETRIITVEPDKFYDIDKVLVDGEAVTLIDGKYKFSNIPEGKHTVSATFKPITFTISASVTTGADTGSISPSGETVVNLSDEEPLSFTITPAAGYVIDRILDNGKPITHEFGVITFEDIDDDHVIRVSFKPEEPELSTGTTYIKVDGFDANGGKYLILNRDKTTNMYAVKLPDVTEGPDSIAVSAQKFSDLSSVPDSFTFDEDVSSLVWTATKKQGDDPYFTLSNSGYLLEVVEGDSSKRQVTAYKTTQNSAYYWFYDKSEVGSGTTDYGPKLKFASGSTYGTPEIYYTNNNNNDGFLGSTSAQTNNSSSRKIYLYKETTTHTVVFKDDDGTILSTVEAEEGTFPTAPEATKESTDDYDYTFLGWKAGDQTYSVADLPAATAPVVYTAVYDAQRKQVFSGHSLTLMGDVGVNFYMNLTDEELAKGAQIEFEWENEGKTKTVCSDIFQNQTNDRSFASCPVPAAEMTQEITATLKIDDEVVATNTYSVAEYAKGILEDEYKEKYLAAGYPESHYEKLVELVKAMLDYGTMAQKQFHCDEDNLANGGTNYYMTAIDPDLINTYSTGMTGNPADYGLAYAGSTVVFLTKTTLRHYFAVKDQTSLDSVNSFTFDGESVTPQKKGSEIVFELPNIAAAQMDTPFTLTIDNFAYNYSVLDYVKAILKSNSIGADMKALATATYWYNNAANAYFGV